MFNKLVRPPIPVFFLIPFVLLFENSLRAQNEYSLDAPGQNQGRTNFETINSSSSPVENFAPNAPDDLFGNSVQNSDQDLGGNPVNVNDDPAGKNDLTTELGPSSTPGNVPLKNTIQPTSVAPSNQTIPIQNPGSSNSTVQAPTVIGVQNQLKTDGSVAPVKFRDPLTPNEFSGAPPLPGARKNLARGYAPEIYEVEAGDTMFDVCSQLIDDGNFWPKLWSLNPDVKNPHFIYPGMKLSFYSGDPSNPPFLELVEEDDMVPVDKGPLVESELIVQEKEVPEHLEAPSNVSIPTESSIVTGPESISNDSSIDDLFVSGGGVYQGTSVAWIVPAFILNNEAEPLGEVLGGLKNEINAGDDIGIKIESEENLATGHIYTVLRYRGEMTHPQSGVFVGYRYDFSGNVRIGGKLGDELFQGKVMNSQTGIRKGDIIMNYLSTKRTVENYSSIGSVGQTDASIVGMGIHSQIFGGEGALVFIDKGGLPAGSFYSIFQKASNASIFADPEDSHDGEGRAVGLVRVVDTNPHYTVGMVLKSSTEIRIGDMLRAH